MSKYLKNLLIDEIKTELDGVEDALVVNLQGVDANTNCELRHRLREKNLKVLVVKNSLARLALKGTPLEPAVADLKGPSALVWGGEDLVSTAKEVVKFQEDKHFEPFHVSGGSMDGEGMDAARVKEVSKWPGRQEMLATIVAQILGPGSQLSSQLISVGGALASQIEQIAEGKAGKEAGSSESSEE